MQGFADEFKDFWAHPFRADMSVPHWFAFLGMLIFLSIAWGMILRAMRG